MQSKKTSETLELEMQAIVSCLTWVMAIKYESSKTAVLALNH